MISVTEAEAIIFAAMARAPVVEIALEAAQGEVLRESIVADRPFPPYHRVAMDGIALALKTWQAGVRAFPVVGIQRAGDPARTLADAGQCLEVMTGAVLPVGCDCVVPVEQIEPADGIATLPDDLELESMQNVHVMGSDRPAGAELLSVGTLLLGPQVAVAAAVGKARVLVAARPRITLIATGDEIVPVESAPLPHQVRRSNAVALRAALGAAGFRDVVVQHVPDEPEVIEDALTRALHDSRFVVLTGGVSEGRYDHVPEVLVRLGVVEKFHKVSQRPGKPLWFGVGPDGQAVFGLPGNPASATVCLYRYVLPALWAHLGARLKEPAARPHAVLAEDVIFKRPLTLFQPVRVCDDVRGACRATPAPMNGSGDLAGLALSDGVVELPAGRRVFAAGEAHVLWRWADIYGLLAS